MQPKLLVNLPPGWQDLSGNAHAGGAMFAKGGASAKGALQVSFGLNPEGTAGLAEEDLVAMAATSDFGHDFGQVVQSFGGPSLFGKMGTAIYRGGKFRRVQVWFLSNGRDVIMASHIAAEEPPEGEIEEVDQIVTNLALVPE